MEKSANKALIIFLVILGFVSGVLGSMGGLAIVSASPFLQKLVGVQQGTLPLQERVENITVKEDSQVIDAVKKVSPAVVSVVFSKDVKVTNPFNFGYPFNQPETQVQKQEGSATGFIITSEGLIATNKHVADFEGASYQVITQDGKKYDAQVLAKDPVNDFAILKIDAKNLPVVDFGDSDSLQIGQRMIAIGNALGEFQNSVTVGVLSGKERNLDGQNQLGGTSESLEGLLQTDAAINEGNSGGPLVTLKGQIVGINTATAAKGQAEGIGFAIPINSLKSAIDSIKKNGKIIRAYIGVTTYSVDQKIAAMRGISAGKGALIIGNESAGLPAVVKGSPADKAGLKEGDVILKVNNDEVNQNTSLRRLINKYQPGEEVTLKILRDNKEQDVKIKLGEMPSS